MYWSSDITAPVAQINNPLTEIGLVCIHNRLEGIVHNLELIALWSDPEEHVGN
jgi:hypothetical protein